MHYQRPICALPGKQAQQGYALITVVAITLILGIIASSTLEKSGHSQSVASAALQRKRAFQAVDAAIELAETELREMTDYRIRSDADASQGVYRRDARSKQWWRSTDYNGQRDIADDMVHGVVRKPRYVYEEIGRYISDGGTGIVSLDVGSASYGSTSLGAREVVLYSVEAYGNGSTEAVQAAAETVLAFTY